MILDGDAGMVLVPGFMLDETLWRDVEPQLSAIAPVVHADLRTGATIAAMADHILATCPPRFVLIGFSLGGYVAREIVRRVPQRVSALILIATSAQPDGPEHAQRKHAAQATSAAGFRGMSRAALAASLHPRLAADKQMIERLRLMNVRLGHEVFVRQSMLDRGDDRDRLHTIACPTLVISADDDRLRRAEEARELADGIPGATLVVMENSGHMIPMEQPAMLAATIVSWLSALPDHAASEH
jgi:pimeloyl-ACP methyl ester carboxylesterase